jgi:hypothetical protein
MTQVAIVAMSVISKEGPPGNKFTTVEPPTPSGFRCCVGDKNYAELNKPVLLDSQLSVITPGIVIFSAPPWTALGLACSKRCACSAGGTLAQGSPSARNFRFENQTTPDKP